MPMSEHFFRRTIDANLNFTENLQTWNDLGYKWWRKMSDTLLFFGGVEYCVDL